MKPRSPAAWIGLVLISILISVPAALARGDGDRRTSDEQRGGSRPPPSAVGDAVLYWNTVALEAVSEDHTGTYGPSAQGGPGPTARALAMVHASIYDAVNSIVRTHTPYLTLAPVPRRKRVSIEAAVAMAAHGALSQLYPAQRAVLDRELRDHLVQIRDGNDKRLGMELGTFVAAAMMEHRTADGSDEPGTYTPGDLPGQHRPDPLNPDQGYWGPTWGEVRPFVIETGAQFRAPAPPAISSAAYARDFNEVKALGGDGVATPTQRTAEQTRIGIYWAYDGSRKIGTPPRMYNQIARVIAEQRGNNVVENARFFALINLALADASIACWDSKYLYKYWRPVIGIREADPGTGPSGLGDDNPDTQGDTTWQPLNSPASNESGNNFTPPFPAYPSGHATFGAALFRVIARYYGTDRLFFRFTSDELNGVTTDNRGVVRPLAPRSFRRLSEAAVENARSRIYLGVHWQVDADAGIRMGNAVGDYVFQNAFLPAAPR